jgi:hypothetical protein
LLKYKVSVKKPFDFGFRTLNVDVKLSDIFERILIAANELKLPKKKLDDVYELLDSFEDKYKSKMNEMKPMWKFWMEYPELTQILKKMGYDSIQAKEGLKSNIETIGVLDFNKTQKL